MIVRSISFSVAFAWLVTFFQIWPTAICFGQDPRPQVSWYRGTLKSPGGDLIFGLRWTHNADAPLVAVVNGDEIIDIPTVKTDPRQSSITLSFDHYDSHIQAKWSDHTQKSLHGNWRKRSAGSNRWVEMPFQAELVGGKSEIYSSSFNSTPSEFGGRYSVQFASDSNPSVGIFEQSKDLIKGTILTITGDFRYLAGTANETGFRMSCFDGAHAFLIDARASGENLTGNFWSGDAFHDTWVAVKNSEAKLPDPFGLTKWNENIRLRDLTFLDLKGVPHHLAENQYSGKALLLQLFGSWCPNCHDAADFLSELHSEYQPQGLSIIGLAFEYSDDPQQNAEQVQRYIQRHGTKYPVLIAGPSDKARATEAFRGLDRIRAFPTTVFINRHGQVHSIYTGFSGPATGEAYSELKKSYRLIIEELLRDE